MSTFINDLLSSVHWSSHRCMIWWPMTRRSSCPPPHSPLELHACLNTCTDSSLYSMQKIDLAHVAVTLFMSILLLLFKIRWHSDSTNNADFFWQIRIILTTTGVCHSFTAMINAANGKLRKQWILSRGNRPTKVDGLKIKSTRRWQINEVLIKPFYFGIATCHH